MGISLSTEALARGAARRPWTTIGAWLVGLVVAMGGIVAAADDSFYEQALYSRVSLPLGLLILASVVYFASLWITPRALSGGQIVLLLAVGVGIRAPMWFAQDIPNADYQRYLWDGAVTGSGMNPYAVSPRQAVQGDGDATMQELARDGRHVLQHVNNPELRTCYPPVAQGLFAIAHWITPFNPTGWRIVLLLCDAAAAVGVLTLLRSAKLPASRWAIYLWNPLLVFETYLRCHLDVAVGAALILLLLALARRRKILSAVALTAAIGIKLYPLMLVPLLIRAAWGNWRRLAATCATCAVMLAVLAILFAPALRGENSGTFAYAKMWESNAGAFRLVRWVAAGVCGEAEARGNPNMERAARRIMMILLAAVMLWQAWTAKPEPLSLCRAAGVTMIAALLLSPVVWPWYYVSVISLAAVLGARGLLLWTPLLCLAYLPPGVLGEPYRPWIIHVPMWLALAKLLVPFGRARSNDGVVEADV